jgi:HNH endonuclease
VPGCGRTRYLHAHHVLPWALGGATSLDNLVLLCGDHHRLLHDGGFAIVACGEQCFRHYGPDGRPLVGAPDLTGEPDAVAAAYTDITPATIEADWDGSDLRLHDAVAAYLTAWALPTTGEAVSLRRQPAPSAGSVSRSSPGSSTQAGAGPAQADSQSPIRLPSVSVK